MERALFIVRDSSGKSLFASERAIHGNLILDAHFVMECVQADKPLESVERCELWTFADDHTMNLLVTVF